MEFRFETIEYDKSLPSLPKHSGVYKIFDIRDKLIVLDKTSNLFERFERYCPYGTPDDVAEFLAPYVAAGCTDFNLVPQSPDADQAIAYTAAVKRRLAAG